MEGGIAMVVGVIVMVEDETVTAGK